MGLNMEQPPEINIQPFTPVMSKERFAELSGVPFGVVEGWVIRGYLPSLLIGKHRLVNIIQLNQDCLEQLPK